MQPDAQRPNDTPALASGLPADVLALCSDMDATIRAMVRADDLMQAVRLHRRARALEVQLRLRVRAGRLP